MTAAASPPFKAPLRKAVRVHVFGRVQGVWYRGWTVETASGLGLSGWVRNRSDGTVEALFAGPPETVDRMVEACRRGPPAAVVRDVAVETADDPGPGSFEQRGTL